MADVSVFKRKDLLKDGTLSISKNYYFWCNRKKINSHISNKKQAEKFAVGYIEEFEKKKIQQVPSFPKATPNTPTLFEKLQKDGWMVIGDDGKLDYKQNPKYKLAQTSTSLSYGIQQSKQVGNILIRIFITNKDILGNYQYNQISKHDAMEFRSRLADNDMPNSMKNETLKAMRAIFTFWAVDETITYNPFKKSRAMDNFPIETTDSRSIFSKEELRTIFNENRLALLYPNDREWLSFLEGDYYKSYKFCALTGLRSAEVRCLIPSQFSNERLLTINRAFKANNTRLSSIGFPKCDKERLVIVCDSAYEVIKNKISYLNDYKYIFTNSAGEALDASRWGKNFQYFMEKISTSDVYNKFFSGKYYTPHCLRKTLNTLLVNESQINKELVITYFGWGENIKSSLTKTQRDHYTKTTAAQLIPVAREIEKLYSGKQMIWDILGKNVSVNDLKLKEANLMFEAENTKDDE